MRRVFRGLRWVAQDLTGPRLPDQRRSFEEIEAALTPSDNGASRLPPNNDGGVLAWSTSWRMQAYLLMAETTGDPSYLRRLVRTFDAVLDLRDNVLGYTDFRGRSLPVWSATRRYTVVIITIPDTAGRPALQVRLCPPHALNSAVTVTPRADRTFDLSIVRGDGTTHRLAGLSLDPAHPRRADRAAYDAYTVENGTTIRLLPAAAGGPTAGDTTAGGATGDAPTGGAIADDAAGGGSERRVAAGEFRGGPARATQAAHTGMIVHPVGGLARLARERPDLVPAEVSRRIDGYLAAAEEALATHDEQWRVSPEGEGYYVWLRDEPVSHAGAELPTNEFLTIGRASVQLAAATGDPRHVERAAAMARTLRRQMHEQDGVLVWPYWPSFGHVYRGWTRTGDPATDVSEFRPDFKAVPVPEDVTHALVDIDFACLYAATPGLPGVFTEADMRALGRTFTRHVALRRFGRRPTVRRDVSGRGRPGSPRHEAHVACWLPLCQWEPAVRTPVLAVHHSRRPTETLGVDSYCAAIIHRWR